MSKSCRNCGAEMADNMNFCQKCHAKNDAPASPDSTSRQAGSEGSNAAFSHIQKVELSFWEKMWQKRMARKDFWIWQLISWGVSLGAGWIPGVGQIIAIVIGLYSFIIEWSRLHDAGKSAWNLLWYLLPIIGWTVLIVLYCQPSEKGENAWGSEPQRMFGVN